MNERRIVLSSPFLIIAVNLVVALLFGQMLGKWAFVPMILIGWVLWLFLIMKFGKAESIKKWLAKPTGGIVWSLKLLQAHFSTVRPFNFRTEL